MRPASPAHERPADIARGGEVEARQTYGFPALAFAAS